ncbi:MAG: hypothetical protein ACI8UO_001296 [Verrucomicrobiales bacterium]|jgi:hypothetical protein
MIRLCLAFLLTLATSVFAAEHERAIAVLEQNCLACHNSGDHKGDVILDRSPIQIDDLKHIIESVSGADPDMPKKADPLKSDEIAALRVWVEAGAPIPDGRILQDRKVADREWWSLKPIVAPKPPAAADWGRNEIDRFVLAKLHEKGLSPSVEAAARTLIRRLTFDLTGLPPTPEAVRKFVADSAEDSENAYANLVEQLLASERYGEQWARHWLDLARYGESHGYDKDKARFNAWPYRDYVIRSFNDDKPWSRFVQEQVAGDVLWPGDPDGIVALGFIAAGPWDFIAHHEVGEAKLDGRIAKHLDRDDMVSVVFNTFMSTTVQCAQCHNHKFDPVSMEDYYRLHTIFAAVDRRPRVFDLDPDIIKKRQGLEQKIAELNARLKAVQAEIDKEGGESLAELKKQIAKLKEDGKAGLKTVPEHGYHSGMGKSASDEKWVDVELAEQAAIDRIELIGCHDDFGGIGAGFGFPVRFRVEIGDGEKFRTIADFTADDYPNPGVAPVTVNVKGEQGSVVRITATKLAKRVDSWILALAEARIFDADGNNLAAGATVKSKDSIEAPSRWSRANLVDGKFPTGGDPESVAEFTSKNTELQQLLTRLTTEDRKKRQADANAELETKGKELAALPEGKLVYAIATEFKPQGQVKPTKGKPREIRLLHRGDLRTPGDVMKPGAPALWGGVTPEFDLGEVDTEGGRRAALASYLTTKDNPLVWRSAVNRIWLYHMGRGIVDSPNDFGRMGMQPTHLELLDWLASRFLETESVKDLHRLIVTSSTYRQSSADDSAKTEIDSGNAFYWRANRRKLRAEELRDSVLAVSGALDLKMGGPSFRDFQFKDDHTPKYWYHLHDPNDPDTHRRTIYRFIARSQTQPFLTTLDCADPSQMVAKRDETTTALQALVLMNNPFMIAMSQKLAENVEESNQPIAQAVWVALGRAPTADEIQLLSSYSKKHGLAAACRLIFNLNEFAYLD